MGCKVDLRTRLIKNQGITEINEKRGKDILELAWETHGYDNLSHRKNYTFQGKDIWRGLFGRLGKPWPEAESNMLFRFEVGSFDSQVTYLDGKQMGITAGLQSWNYYEFERKNAAKKKKLNQRTRFALSAYHYFFELLDRLKRAPLISWAGEKQFNNEVYDVIFVTWKQVEPHMDNDQYILWINKETNMLDYAIYTVRENYLKIPGSRAFYGSIRFDDYRKVNGLMVPHVQTVFLNAPKKNIKRHVHRLTVSDFQFDAFDQELLKPFADVTSTGDSKTKG